MSYGRNLLKLLRRSSLSITGRSPEACFCHSLPETSFSSSLQTHDTQHHAKVHELDPQYSASAPTTQRNSTPCAIQASHPDALLAMVHDVTHHDSTMSPSEFDRVLSVSTAASKAANRGVHAHRQYVFQHVNKSHGQLVDREQVVAQQDLTSKSFTRPTGI